MTAVLALAVLVATGVSVWGVLRLADRVDAAAAEHSRLRAVHELSLVVLQAREATRPTDAGAAGQALTSMHRVQLGMERWGEPLSGQATAALTELIDQLRASRAAMEDGDESAAWQSFGAFNAALNKLTRETVGAREAIERLEGEAEEEAAWVTRMAVMTTAGVLLLLVATLVGVRRSLLGPIDGLVAGVRRVALGRFDERVEARGPPELASVAEQFNEMAGRLELLYADMASQVRERSEALARAERLASVGYLAAGVAHEINNPLAIMTSEAELVLRREGIGDDSRQVLGVIVEEAYRCKRITEQLLDLTRPAPGQAERIDLDGLLERVAEEAGRLEQARDRSLRVKGSGLVAVSQRPLLKQVLLNLTVNALEATAAGSGRVSLTAERCVERDGVRVIVADNGVGLEPEVLQRVFEPFFTMRGGHRSGMPGRAEGLGLGLTISHAIVAGLGGRLVAESDGPGRGSRFVVELRQAVEDGEGPRVRLNVEAGRG